MKSKFKKSFSIIKLVYDIKDEKAIIIFHPDFVETNKNSCKMIINNKLSLLTDRYEVIDENKKLLKIKLLILNNKKRYFSHMFHECKSLKEFHIISVEEEISNLEDKNEKIKNKDSFADLNNQSNNEILNSNNNNLTNTSNDAIKIYNKYNGLYGNSEKEHTNLSDEFLLFSNNTIKSQNNNHIQNNSFYENSFSFKSWKIKRMNINESETKKYIIKKDNIIVTDMRYIFYGCSSLLSITGLSKINTSNVIYMDHIFEN